MASLATMARRGGRSLPRKAALDPSKYRVEPPQQVRPLAISDDLRLFAYTFLGGFVFVSVLIS